MSIDVSLSMAMINDVLLTGVVFQLVKVVHCSTTPCRHGARSENACGFLGFMGTG